MTPESPEVRWHASTAAFEEDEPEISEDLADAIALGFEAFLFALVVVVLALVLWAAI
jgi:hypothetical protein